MNHPTRLPKKHFSLSLQPAEAWSAILALGLLTVLLILAGAGRILNLVFPVGALAVGVRLYFRYPILYCGFAWWIMFLTPLIRRLADYRSGYTESSPILLAPFLVFGVTLVSVWRHLPKTHLQGGLPFVLSFVGIFYGFLIGLIHRSPIIVCKSLLEWVVPVSFSFYLFINWRNYPSYRQNIYRVFVWATLLMGLYGIYQYVVAPEWDRIWLINSGMMSSQGLPQPLGIRVWSTMNSAEPFAVVIAAGLLLLFTSQGTLIAFSSTAGYLAFLLSMVRAAWVGWLAGLLTLIASLKPKNQMRLIIIVLVIALLVVPLTTIEPFSTTINDRLSTFSNLEEDGSARTRKATYAWLLTQALVSFIGEGIGGSFHDSTILALFLNIGWIGTIFYMSGMLLLSFKLFQSSEGNSDPFTGTARAIVISGFVRLPLTAAIVGPSGVIFWEFLALGLAAQKYYRHQRLNQFNQSSVSNYSSVKKEE